MQATSPRKASARACTVPLSADRAISIARNGHYSNHNCQQSKDMLTGANRFHGQWGMAGWVGYQYANSLPGTIARRFPMVVNDFGDLVEVAA